MAGPLLTDSLLDNMPCGFLSFADDGTMKAVNSTLAEMLGYTRAELEGWHLQKILPPGGRIFYNTHVFPLLKMHGMAEEVYVALRTKDGLDVPVLMNAARGQREGEPVNDCIFVRMLQRHEYEEQLLQARRLAEQAAESKTKFLSMMSHDLRTPLTAISGHADMLAAGFLGPLSDAQRESAEAIKRAAHEVARMMDDILAFAQLDSGKVRVAPTTVPLRAAIQRAESLIRLRAEQAGLSLDAEPCPAEAAVTADADRLQQILLNLLTNAIKFTPPGGRITIACDETDHRVRIHVRDTGVGIPLDQLEHIFEPFVQLGSQTSNTTQQGVGLGLAISRDLARAMKGDLTASSTPGHGSVFTIELPTAAAVSVT